jgi:hypothetical protein
MKCTWKGCENEAHNPLKDRNGKEWANLCDNHDCAFTYAVDSEDKKKIMRAYVLAGGGAEATAKRVWGMS